MWLKVGLILTILYFSFVLSGMLFANLNFGNGLGDLIYFYLLMVWIIVLLITLVFISNIKKKVGRITTALILTILFSSVIFISIEFTINRGPCYPWNGKVFMESFVTIQKNKEIVMQNKIDSLSIKIKNDSFDKASLTERGRLYFQKNEIKLSKADFENALEIDSNYYEALIGLSDIYRHDSDFIRASQILDKAFLVYPLKDEKMKFNNKKKE